MLSDKILSRQLTLTSRLTTNNFKYILRYTWNLIILKYYLLFIWNSNLTGCPLFLSAKFVSPYPQHKISRSYCISFTFANIKLFSYLFYRLMEVKTLSFLPLTFWQDTQPQVDVKWTFVNEAFFWKSNYCQPPDQFGNYTNVGLADMSFYSKKKIHGVTERCVVPSDPLVR